MVDVFWVGEILLVLVVLPFAIRWVRRIRRHTPEVVIERRWVGHRARIFFYIYAAAFAVAGLGLLLVRPEVEGGAIELGIIALGIALIGLSIVVISHMMALRADTDGIVVGAAVIPWDEVRSVDFSVGLGIRVETVRKIPLMRRWNADPYTCEFSSFAFDIDEAKVERMLSLYRTHSEAHPESVRSLA